MSRLFGSKLLRRSAASCSSKYTTGILLLQLASVTTGTTTRSSIPFSGAKSRTPEWLEVTEHLRAANKRCVIVDGGKRDYSRNIETVDMAAKELVKVDFEVYGRVQGVFFRKYTQDEAASLGLRGHCRNTSSGTVRGTLEGPRPQVERMKAWLRSTGSPMSRIEKVEFRNEETIDSYSLKGAFGIERTI